jgi:mycofactocin biosynthetic radical S-adenosylmethionine protein MftC
MGYRELLKRLHTENILFSVLLELTHRCNLDCFLCYSDRSLQGTALSLEQYHRLFYDLVEMGTMNLTLSGGEPLVHPHFFALGKKARELGFVVRIKSNGHTIHGETLRRIKDEIDPFYVEVSLHGACAATHDRQTRVPGSFQRLMANLEAMRTAGLRFRLRIPVTCWNEAEIEEMVGIADRLGVTVDCDPQITPRDDGDLMPLSISPSLEAVRKLYRILRARRAAAGDAGPTSTDPGEPATPEQPSKHCGAASMSVTVDPLGNVLPCVQWRVPAGNLHCQSIKEIWESSPVLRDIRRKSEEVATSLHNRDPRLTKVGFCPASAEQQTGSHLQLYPAVIRNMQGME